MLCWSIISLASFLLLASLDETICGTLPRSGVHLKPPSVPEAPAARINKTIVDSHVGHQGHNSAAQRNIPAKDQSSMHRREKPLTDMAGSNDTHDKTGQLQKAQSVQAGFAAFTVSNTGPDQGPYTEDKIVTFNSVITSIGGGFDPMFSVFTCKVSGVYFFVVSTMGLQRTNNDVHLVHDGRTIINSFGQGPYGTAVMTAYLRVVAGGRVYVTLTKGYAVRGLWSSFSGSLVKSDAAT